MVTPLTPGDRMRDWAAMVATSLWSGRVEPDYFQFCARRGDAGWASDQVSEEGRRDRLWSNGGFVYVSTRRKYGSMPIGVHLLDRQPGDPLGEWDHVAEVSLDESGPFEVFSWGDEEPVARIATPGGGLRLRVLWKGLIAGRFEGLDQDGASDEQILMEIWPAPPRPPTVVRRWDGWPPSAP